MTQADRIREPAAPYGSAFDDDPKLPDFETFAKTVLDWSFSPKGYAGTKEHPIPSELELPLPDYGETLRPDFAVRELEPKDGAAPWQLLVRVIEPGEDFDRVSQDGGNLEASPHGRLERLLRAKAIPAGLLVNGHALRLVSVPRGESSGWIDFRVADMVQTAGRPISAALRLLLSEQRLLALPRQERLAALLADSRKYQNEVSERLAEQVLHALYELLRGFQAAHDMSQGTLLRTPLQENPDEVYRALLARLMLASTIGGYRQRLRGEGGAIMQGAGMMNMTDYRACLLSSSWVSSKRFGNPQAKRSSSGGPLTPSSVSSRRWWSLPARPVV